MWPIPDLMVCTLPDHKPASRNGVADEFAKASCADASGGCLRELATAELQPGSCPNSLAARTLALRPET
ncbi:MAG: hypothetical protein ACLPXB_02835, partial [Thiobacillaceae bacterium]